MSKIHTNVQNKLNLDMSPAKEIAKTAQKREFKEYNLFDTPLISFFLILCKNVAKSWSPEHAINPNKISVSFKISPANKKPRMNGTNITYFFIEYDKSSHDCFLMDKKYKTRNIIKIIK